MEQFFYLFFTDVANVIKQMPRIPKAEDLSTLFDQQRENIQANRGLAGGSFGAGGSLGFGFRGTIPKLPSFKVRIIFLLTRCLDLTSFKYERIIL